MKKFIKSIIIYFVLIFALLLPTINVYALESTYHGFNVVGNIEIQKISLDIPILEKVTNASLQESVAFLYGEGINKVGNTVIVGHNLKDGRFFSNLSQLTNGDYIKITDSEDNSINYKIYNIEILSAEDTSFYNRDTNGKKEITLSTATDDTTSRLIVFAKETSEDINNNSSNYIFEPLHVDRTKYFNGNKR